MEEPSGARLRLQTLGSMTVVREGPGNARLVTQRRRLAILALLAAAGERGASRDSVIALIWPESDSEGGRHSLRQALYGLRRDIGPVVVVGSTELRLDPALVSSDVAEFDDLIARDDLAAAVSLYAGPFLDGFHLGGSSEFEQWVDSTRARLANGFATALQQLARNAGAHGNRDEAVDYWRRVAELDPLSSRFTLHLATALVAAHDQAGALRAIDAHERLARAELGIALPEALATLRAACRKAADPVAPSPTPSPPLPEPSPVQANDTVVGAGLTPAPGTLAVPQSLRPHRYWSRALVGATGAALLVLALRGRDGLVAIDTPAEPSHVTAGRIVVLPFDVDAPGQVVMAAGIGALVGATADGIAGLTFVDPSTIASRRDTAVTGARARMLARGVGASMYVLGHVTRAGRMLRLSTALYRSGSDSAPVSRAEVEGPLDSVSTIAARTATILFATQIAGMNAPIEQRAAFGSASPAALRSYLQGEWAFRMAHYADAADAFEEAVAKDSTFTLAYYRLSIADDWASRGPAALSAADHAYRLHHGLTPHDSLRLEGLRAWRRGDDDRAELLYRSMVSAYPWDIEASYQLGEVLFHGNAQRGRTVREAQPAFDRVLAVQPTNREALVHLQLLAALDRDPVRLASLTRRIKAAVPDSESLSQLAVAAFGLPDSALEAHVMTALRARDGATIYNVAWRVSVFTGNLDGALRVASLLTAPAQPASTRALGFGTQSFLHLAQGRSRAATADLASGAPLLPNWTLHLRAWKSTFPAAPAPAGVRRSLLDTLLHHVPPVERKPGAWIPVYSFPEQRAHDNVFLQALLAMSLNDDARMRRARAWAVAHPSPVKGTVTLPQEIDAMELAAGGDYERALARVPLLAESQAAGFGAQVTLRFMLGQWAMGAGRVDEAIDHFGSFEELDLPSLAYAASAHQLRGALFERKGDTGNAVREYNRVLELWRDCDSSLYPARDSVRVRLRALSSGGPPTK